MGDDKKNPLSNLPLEKVMGHMTYGLSRMDDYCLGPLAQLTKRLINSLKTAVRVNGGDLEYNPELLRDMGSLDGSTAIKGELFFMALHLMDRMKVVTGGQEKFKPYAALAAALSVMHKLATDNRKVGDKFYHPKDFGFPEDLSFEKYFKMLIEKDQQAGRDPDRFDPTSQRMQQAIQQAMNQQAQNQLKQKMEELREQMQDLANKMDKQSGGTKEQEQQREDMQGQMQNMSNQMNQLQMDLNLGGQSGNKSGQSQRQGGRSQSDQDGEEQDGDDSQSQPGGKKQDKPQQGKFCGTTGDDKLDDLLNQMEQTASDINRLDQKLQQGKGQGKGKPQPQQSQGQPQQGQDQTQNEMEQKVDQLQDQMNQLENMLRNMQDQGQGEGDGQESQGMQDVQDLAGDLGCKNPSEKHGVDCSKWHKVNPGQEHRMAETLANELERSSKERGTLPNGLKRLIKEIRDTVKEKWYEKVIKLSGTMLSTDTYRYSRKRPSKRYGIPYPGRMRNKTDPVFGAIDTSGSIGANDLQIFVEKFAGLCKRRQAELTIIVCDCEIKSVHKVCRKHDIETIDFRGGGGTSSLPVFKYLKDKKVGMLVYLTDLYIDFPPAEEKPPYPVIWGVINRGEDEKLEVPFGEIYHLQVDKDTNI